LATPWSEAILIKFGKYLTLDFSIRRPVCGALLAGFSRIPGVARVATTGATADERTAPLTDEQAAQACAQYSGLIRLILEQPVDPSPDISEAENEVFHALPALIGSIQSSGSAIPDGPINLAVLRRANVDVPTLFVRGERLATPWSEATLIKSGKYLTLDFSIRRPVCGALLAGFSQISGVVRVATSLASPDEQTAPLTNEQAALACAQHSGLVRLILDTRP
jgi:hypothetical protein